MEKRANIVLKFTVMALMLSAVLLGVQRCGKPYNPGPDRWHQF